jgi:2OG-Fe(II) oxygenase superfamily
MAILNIINDFISDVEVESIKNLLDSRSVTTPRKNHKCALGYENIQQAEKVGPAHPATWLTGDPNDDAAVWVLTNVMERVKASIGDAYSSELRLLHATYTEISEGYGMVAHADNEYGNDLEMSQGFPGVLKYSAVLYLNSGNGLDFSGGNLHFVNQDITYVPIKASLVYFEGISENVHEVENILSGKRKSITFFYGLKI